MRHIFIAAAAIGLVFALGFFVAGASQAAGYDTLTALLYADVAPAPLGNTGYFQTAMLGGLYAGWSVTMLIVATDEALWRHPRTWTAILVGLLVWFVLDSAGSIATGAIFNVIGNAVYWLAMSIPAWFLRRAAPAPARVELLAQPRLRARASAAT